MLKTIGLFILFFLFVLIVRVLGKKKSGAADNAAGMLESNNQESDNLQHLPAVQLNEIGVLSQFEGLPVWFDYAQDEHQPAIYEGTFWEVEPQGEYIFYLAGDYSKNAKGHLNFTSASMVFTVLASFEVNSVDIMQHDGDRYQHTADTCGIDVNQYLSKNVGEIIDELQPEQPVDPGYQQFISLMNKLPAGANGNARLFVGENWFTGKGMKLSLVYQEFREPAVEGEQRRAVWVECHCMRKEQSFDELLAHFLVLVARYKSMPYQTLSGASAF